MAKKNLKIAGAPSIGDEALNIVENATAQIEMVAGEIEAVQSEPETDGQTSNQDGGWDVTDTTSDQELVELTDAELVELKSSPAFAGSEVQLSEEDEMIAQLATENGITVDEAKAMLAATTDDTSVKPVETPVVTGSKPPRKTVTLELPFVSESNAYIGFDMDGQERWLAKSSLVSYLIDKDTKTVSVKIPRALAMKRKLVTPEQLAA